ncbi:hypothetical protein IFM89_037429 [Coptis chinensis]|uniref:Reverse transcriptase zinc-binding domain-containing protein n=1 Tax=Coptis chinensis TaxID=261450 RepID=A0A835MK51_9MAGN|nr:hypothetical protein IFM89_037429 [Coptis chinensis]
MDAVMDNGKFRNIFINWPFYNSERFKAITWKLLPYAVCWSVWVTRNKTIFQNKNVSMEKVICLVKGTIWFWLDAYEDRRDHHFYELVFDWENLINET